MNQLKSRTIRFNLTMAAIDGLLANAVFLQDLITVKEFAVTMILLKIVQSVGNIYYRNVTTGSIGE